MTRRTYRYNSETKQMEETTPSPRIPHGIFEDNFQSIVDGSVITNQKKLHEHNLRNNVRQVTDEDWYQWNEAQKVRDDFFSGHRLGKADRIEALKHAYEINQRKRRR